MGDSPAENAGLSLLWQRSGIGHIDAHIACHSLAHSRDTGKNCLYQGECREHPLNHPKDPMSTTALTAADFARELEQYQHRAYDDMRKVTVGLQETSNQAAIYDEYSHLFTQDQLGVLAQERDAASGEDQEKSRRLWFETAAAVAERDLVHEGDALLNERLAWRTDFDGESVSYNALGALIATEPDFDRRERAYSLMVEADKHFADRELDLMTRSQQIRADVFGLDGEVAIASARSGIDLDRFSAQVNAVCDATRDAFEQRAREIVPQLLGRSVDRPSRAHGPFMRSLHEFDDVFSSERLVDVCSQTMIDLGFPLDSIPTILPDLEDRPLKDPRACVIPTKVPHEVHLVLRPTGGISDYQAFLHEAGHALHFGLTDAALPFEYRALSPDHALTEIYSFIVERITHCPSWHQRHFGLDRAEAERVCSLIRFIDAGLFRRYVAKLEFELGFWRDPTNSNHPQRYVELLSNATLNTYPPETFVSDMDPGLYSADYLRAWRTSEQVIAQLREQHGEDWYASGAVHEFLRDLFHQGTRPTNEQISEQIGSSPDNFDALTHQMSA